ncbi:Phycoerythrin class 2 subunit gamma, linker polypeptide [Synechococcus sp. MIT S9509]|uniref:phycobilisome rod-core linker polypeptide n=1 Tax=unclassified Synechococcus TaxID=2626047 RepID=UPI0007BBFA11|nr:MULTISPECIES: phycobilisome rod-core linker polypeptide [unclassified Synechococcus]KZR86398.1 Phycoerythrin class 2 subunit gamma, linker polypeptide [Synechococcus sp. MIT S9504]KZR93464.1 Phycoerythrin class 2 subunit gamma, linker polypeptide [Synechococcus sp. MIT S9509]
MLGPETSLKSNTSATRTGPAAYSTPSKAGKNTIHRTFAGARAEYKRQHCASMGIGIGPRLHAECPFGAVFDQYNPDNSAALERVIAAAYRQVFGNLHPRESQRETSLEVRMMNGEITVRDFVNGLAKSDFYKANFFHSVGAQRGIELNFKHLLGRPPLNQEEVQNHIKLQAEAGFDALIDKLTDSAEYTEVFGSDIVPYERSHDSYAGMFTRSFNLMRELGGMKVAVSDNAQGRNSRTINPLAIASREEAKPQAFTYTSVQRTPVKLPQQQYSGHQTPKMTDYVAFRPFGVHF